ncbi:hypothetical protein MTR_5g037330 [Medicago truncatula]|uniref:Uncharacterized protein n=1 Tax=Medicago truncatula TaxID=3880 RepID=G7K8A2_MEDTR|nr:hypothetical protein MTR_5g037330 [Medicago truncatula]
MLNILVKKSIFLVAKTIWQCQSLRVNEGEATVGSLRIQENNAFSGRTHGIKGEKY